LEAVSLLGNPHAVTGRSSLITDNKRDRLFLVSESRKVHGQYDSIRVKDIGQSSRVVLVVACYDFGLIVIRSTH